MSMKSSIYLPDCLFGTRSPPFRPDRSPTHCNLPASLSHVACRGVREANPGVASTALHNTHRIAENTGKSYHIWAWKSLKHRKDREGRQLRSDEVRLKERTPKEVGMGKQKGLDG